MPFSVTELYNIELFDEFFQIDSIEPIVIDLVSINDIAALAFRMKSITLIIFKGVIGYAVPVGEYKDSGFWISGIHHQETVHGACAGRDGDGAAISDGRYHWCSFTGIDSPEDNARLAQVKVFIIVSAQNIDCRARIWIDPKHPGCW